MKRNLTLILLFSIMYCKVFGQMNNALPQPKSLVRLENRLDSTKIKAPENAKNQSRPDTSATIVCLCCGSTSPQPLFLIKRHNKIFVLDSLSRISPNWIQNIYITKEASQIAQYGAKAKDGVVIITLNEKDHPEAYKSIKHELKKFRPLLD
jgi:hypothetical protein